MRSYNALNSFNFLRFYGAEPTDRISDLPLNTNLNKITPERPIISLTGDVLSWDYGNYYKGTIYQGASPNGSFTAIANINQSVKQYRVDDIVAYYKIVFQSKHGFHESNVVWNSKSPKFSSFTDYGVRFSAVSASGGWHISRDGRFIFYESASQTVSSHILRTPWDLSTTTSTSQTLNVSTQITSIGQIWISPNGAYLFVTESTASSEAVFRYSMSTPFDLSTASYDSNTISTTSGSANEGATFTDDGLKFFIPDLTNDLIDTWTMTTPFDLSTATLGTVGTAVDSGSTQAIFISHDGKNLYWAEAVSTDVITEYRLTTAFDMTTIVATGRSIDISGIGGATSWYKLLFSPDGNRMFVQDISTDIFQLDMA